MANETKTPDTTTPEAPAVRVCSVYKSAMQSHKVITPTGKVLSVVNYQHITDNADDIEFLDEEIRKGFPYLKKLSDIEVKEADPMHALREKLKQEAIAEYVATQKAEAKQNGPDINAARNIGASETKGAKPAVTAASTATLAGLTSTSNS